MKLYFSLRIFMTSHSMIVTFSLSSGSVNESFAPCPLSWTCNLLAQKQQLSAITLYSMIFIPTYSGFTFRHTVLPPPSHPYRRTSPTKEQKKERMNHCNLSLILLLIFQCLLCCDKKISNYGSSEQTSGKVHFWKR